MALPLLYNEKQLAEFLRRRIKRFAALFGWDNVEANGDYQDAINAALRDYGVTTIAAATDIPKLETLALRAIWREVVEAAAGEYDYTAGGDSQTRSQLYKQATERLAEATAAADALPDQSSSTMPPIGIGQIRWKDDPYEYTAERTAALNGTN